MLCSSIFKSGLCLMAMAPSISVETAATACHQLQVIDLDVTVTLVLRCSPSWLTQVTVRRMLGPGGPTFRITEAPVGRVGSTRAGFHARR